jgi:hypothetical protein
MESDNHEKNMLTSRTRTVDVLKLQHRLIKNLTHTTRGKIICETNYRPDERERQRKENNTKIKEKNALVTKIRR